MIIEVLASGSKGNAYLITGDKQTLLLEAGLSFKELKQKLGFRLPDACLVSHSHLDHAKCAKDLVRLGVKCYMSYDTCVALGIENHSVVSIDLNDEFVFKSIDVGEFKVLFFDTQHDCSGSLGFLMLHKETGKKILFATDTYYIMYNFKGVSLAMIECNYAKDILDENTNSGHVPANMRERIIRSHFELENVKGMLQRMDKSRLERVMLLHLSDSNSDEERFKREVQEVTGVAVDIAVPGLNVNL